jgi:acid stress-induced BolA-like protein IbaG/YrbA
MYTFEIVDVFDFLQYGNFQLEKNNYQFKEIVVDDDFEVNGLLALHQYIYLNIVQFLGSSIVRKV